jgi:signal peptidase I
MQENNPIEEEIKDRPRSFKEEVYDLFKVVVISLIIVLPIRLYIAQPFIVRGASMEPNFLNGEYLIVDEISYRLDEPQRGDVIVFRYPEDPSQFFIKRIIGLPHDTVIIKGGTVTIVNDEVPDGLLLDEAYISIETLTAPDGETIVGPDEYFVLGDNRSFSSDSRRWGTLDEEFLVGRAWLRL